MQHGEQGLQTWSLPAWIIRLWLKISKCNCTYNQCANCISIYLSCTSMPIVSNNKLEKYLCYVVMIRGFSGRWPRRFLKPWKCTIICLSSMPANLCLSQHSRSSLDTKSFNELAKMLALDPSLDTICSSPGACKMFASNPSLAVCSLNTSGSRTTWALHRKLD